MDIEWKSGDECIYKGGAAVIVGYHPAENTIIIDSYLSGLEACDSGELSKQETTQQREERELCEDIDSAYDLAPDHLQIPVNLYVAQLLLQMGYRKQ